VSFSRLLKVAKVSELTTFSGNEFQTAGAATATEITGVAQGRSSVGSELKDT